MIDPDHQAIMVKADRDGADSSVLVSYHLLGEGGGDLAELLRSGQGAAPTGEVTSSLRLHYTLSPVHPYRPLSYDIKNHMKINLMKFI